MELKQWWDSNRGTILVLTFALLACMYTIATGTKYAHTCNMHWVGELEKMYDACECSCGQEYIDYEQFNGTYNLNIFEVDDGK